MSGPSRLAAIVVPGIRSKRAGDRWNHRVFKGTDPLSAEQGAAMPDSLDQLCIDTIRFLSVDAVQKANSGHPGMPLGAAPMAYVIWTKFLKHNPVNPNW